MPQLRRNYDNEILRSCIITRRKAERKLMHLKISMSFSFDMLQIDEGRAFQGKLDPIKTQRFPVRSDV